MSEDAALPTLPADVSAKWRERLDRRMSMPDRVVAQNLWDGTVELAPKAAVGVMTRKVHVEKPYAGIKYDAPARYRIVNGNEAAPLWAIWIADTYFHSMWLKNAADYNDCIGKARNARRRVGDVDVANLDLIDDQGVRQEAVEIARLEELGKFFGQKSREAKAAWLTLRGHLKTVAERARLAADQEERDALDRAVAEDEARRERVKQAVKAEMKQKVS